MRWQRPLISEYILRCYSLARSKWDKHHCNEYNNGKDVRQKIVGFGTSDVVINGLVNERRVNNDQTDKASYRSYD